MVDLSLDARCRNETNMSRAAYEIRAVGSVPPDLLEDYVGASVTHEPAGSTIRLVLADEAQLHGVLEALRRSGFDLIEMHREPHLDDPAQVDPRHPDTTLPEP